MRARRDDATTSPSPARTSSPAARAHGAFEVPRRWQAERRLRVRRLYSGPIQLPGFLEVELLLRLQRAHSRDGAEALP